ncbi:MAG TPA: ATP-dependent helicase HrpB [Xanthobacteraceae bacterium]|nr:ATP-dependent helicase HrpB [Xanthobacteraceae bacterium]
MDFSPLPIDAVVPELTGALRANNAAVLVAPPGAGKTTKVPLVLANEDWAKDAKKDGRILVLEPRRLAARAAAERMAKTLGERVGETVGLRVRFGSKVSRKTRIEIITEGIFTRLILDDPMLDGVAAVLFDEFHERSLDADLGLALARDVQQGLREDLRILVMSATIDGARVSGLLGNAPVIESEGRAFPVETRYAGRDASPVEPQMAGTILRAMRAEPGSLLAFLPGAAEIRRTQSQLEGRTDPSTDVVALYGALGGDEQDRAILPAPAGRRKIVLATSIAETSITIEGVRIVVDSGLARVPRYEPDVGVTRLETVRVSRAAADQRRGRAGRTEPGVCYRLWDAPQTAVLEPFARPEILAADLSSFALDLAAWGAAPEKLAFLDPPPRAALAEAKALLTELGAVDADGRITEEGRKLRQLPLPSRLARMVVDAAADGGALPAAELAALIGERGLGGDDIDLRERLNALHRDRSNRGRDARAMAQRWADVAATPLSLVESSDGPGAGRERTAERAAEDMSPREQRVSRPSAIPSPQGGREPTVGALIALAYPERIAKNRGAATGAFLLANGRGANVDSASPLAREPFLAVAELTGTAAQGRILSAAPVTLAEIESRFAGQIASRDDITFDAASGSLRGRRGKRLGAITLAEQPIPVAPGEETASLLAEKIAGIGIDRLPWTKATRQWRDRVMFLRASGGEEWPDLSDAALAKNASEWLAPLLAGKTSIGEIAPDESAAALQGLLPWALKRRLDAEAPTHFEAPTGTHAPIDYEAEGGPKIAIRVQELFGLDRHPTIAGGRVPLVIELLSPAHRPVQTTRDLPGFWRGSYAAVRAEMRGRYPKHPWPDDPIAAPATRRAKPRGT